MADLEKIFKYAVSANASDIHIISGEPLIIRKTGELVKLKTQAPNVSQAMSLIRQFLNKEQMDTLQREKQIDFSTEFSDIGRFRGSIMKHQKGVSAVFRVIPKEIPTLDGLKLPPVVEEVLAHHQGLILVTGATGHGKSTTLAAMINHINQTRSHHVLTLEDPIEFVHPLKKSIITQREVGKHTHSFKNALKAALREDPDVIMIGELRDLESISMAISAAETGHLVIATLSTSNAAKTVERVVDSFPPEEQNQIRAMLSETLKAVITQRLMPSADGKQMMLALEILISNLTITNLIKDSKTFQIPSMIQTAKHLGRCLMDESIASLLHQGLISEDTARLNIDNPKFLRTE